jgi:hypothetical protein
MWKPALALLLALVLSPAVEAARAKRSDPEGPAKKTKWSYSYADLGYFGGRAERSDLEGNNAGVSIGGGYGRRLNRYLAWEFDTLWSARLYETPSNIAFATSQTMLNNTSFMLNARAIAPFWKLEPWIGYGFGLIITAVDIQSSLVVGASAYSDEEIGFASCWRAGLDFMYTRRGRLGVEIRDVDSQANFGGITQGDADVGGQLILFVVKIGVGKEN